MTPSEPLDANLGSSLLLTDLYQLNMLQAYRHKIQEYDGKPKRKRSEGATWPGRKQVIRRYGADGTMLGDLLALEGELAEGEAPIRPVMRQRRHLDLRSLEDSRRGAQAQLERLPTHLQLLEREPPHPIEVSAALQALAREIDCIEMAAR